MNQESPPAALGDLLPRVSRSFNLTLRLLPPPVRPQIGLAYLLARATDTIADTAVVPAQDRLDRLAALRDRILGCRDEPLDFRDLAQNQALPAERELLQHIEEAIAYLKGMSCFDRCCIREVLATITSGQELDLQRFAGASPQQIIGLDADEELEDYTYRVAGCVGGFWTRLCRSHLYPKAPLDLQRYLEDAVRFGKGLQLVNILRDLPSDLRMGRCYVPAEALERVSLDASDLRNPACEPQFRPVYHDYLRRAGDDLAAGWRYTCSTPRTQMKVRVACALPLLIGAETLELLARKNVLDGSQRIKISRRRVKLLLVQALLWHPFQKRWERLFRLRLPEPALPTP